MMKKEKPMMSVTAIIQGQHWSRNLANFGPPHMPLGRLWILLFFGRKLNGLHSYTVLQGWFVN